MCFGVLFYMYTSHYGILLLFCRPSDIERPNAEYEFKILTSIKSFYVSASTTASRNSWFADISDAVA